MKALKPSHREKKRYILISGKDVSADAIKSAILEFIGILGYSKASPTPMKNTKKGIIISINRSELDNVRAAIMLSGKDMRVLKVSGMINNL